MLSGLRRWLLCALLLLWAPSQFAAPPRFAQVTPGHPLTLPQDSGAHPDFRTEWWYVTGWLSTPDGKPIGFQITFFRSATEHDRANPSAFAPTQLIIAHAALSDPSLGKLLHAQKSARAGFGLAYAKEGNTDVALDDWRLLRGADGRYQASIATGEFTLQLSLTPGQPPLLQGDQGYSRKGPQAAQASYYYSEPQLQVSGRLTRAGHEQEVSGSAWLDHEWSTSVLDGDAVGWDWLGANLDDGSALMAFQIRNRSGNKIWAHAALRDASGKVTRLPPEQVSFQPERNWRSPRTDASYPVQQSLRIDANSGAGTDAATWSLIPLQDDQELDSRQSTGSVYWEGAVTVNRDGRRAGRGYLELTGYLKALKF
ncbi:carotenoid 1,2-hydratase [Collimonas antrihumi]|uniref:lipocalin-like domain-containing protein n=1 Tax=Collimonas antrihumi TaxID=1940615 RepID=UPI001B8B06C7|nr:carotenoid 1,2-hydratase [Collimonas antrihumi]